MYDLRGATEAPISETESPLFPWMPLTLLLLLLGSFSAVMDEMLERSSLRMAMKQETCRRFFAICSRFVKVKKHGPPSTRKGVERRKLIVAKLFDRAEGVNSHSTPQKFFKAD
ncbi:hypothetical protein L5515_018364 [Caenorhabditis briggsae]|uniref:Uncharacterized protein n=1 Tax=Caenorhabditis briggsae TaxID=6238 RepID=A0AAE9FB84_CAEBR|nr:hypothetical protein L3Y34_012508 [Caenorhabditis briggsae]UMM42597.1 hypothetical protein L5515_018364 [Caenorhabditis briggsae]